MAKMFQQPWDDWTAEQFLELIGDWKDPNPAPVLGKVYNINKSKTHVQVVRDDLLGYGTKVRMLDYLVSSPEVSEVVYGSCPANGYAQITLPVLCHKYGKKAVLFMAERRPENYTDLQKIAVELPGAKFIWVPNGMLSVTEAKARAYAKEDKRRTLLPIGLEHPTAIACLIKVAREFFPKGPNEFWSVGSSGTLNRSLQLAWPDAEAHIVQVGHKMADRQIGRAILHKCELAFSAEVAKWDAPPFPSVPSYDAKAWKFIVEMARPGALFWNVAG